MIEQLVFDIAQQGTGRDRAALVAYGNKEGLNIQEMISFAMGDKITLRNFGTFQQVHKAERKVRNPATGAESIAPASSTLKFKAAKPK